MAHATLRHTLRASHKQTTIKPLYAVNNAKPSADDSPTSAIDAPETDIWRWEDSSDAIRTYIVFISILAAGTVPALHSNKIADLPYFISLAITTMYIGAHRALNSRQRQPINLKEGVLAPIFASMAIFSTYLFLKYFPDLSLQSFFDAYFWILATFATIGAFGSPARILGHKLNQPSMQISLPSWLGAVDDQGSPIQSTTLAMSDVLVVLLGLALATLDLTSHHSNFTLNNTIACLVAADILQLIGLSSFRAATVLLLGMLAYDAFWVFGSPSTVGENVMLQVATSDVLVGPTRLIFPRVPGSIGEASAFPFSLLGLGDVAIPGLLACLALRFDASRTIDMGARGAAAASAMMNAIDSLKEDASGEEIARATGDAAEAAYDAVADLELEQRKRTQGESSSGSYETIFAVSEAVMAQRRYFVPVMVSYVAGLSLAFAANAVTGRGQPALIYIVPAMLGTVGWMAALRGEVGRVWGYKDTTSSSVVGGKKDSL